MSGFGEWAIDLIMTPGSSLKLVPAINISIILLLVVVISLLYNTIDKIHLVVLSFLSLGLLTSVNLFVAEFNKIQSEQSSSGDTDDSAPINSPAGNTRSRRKKSD